MTETDLPPRPASFLYCDTEYSFFSARGYGYVIIKGILKEICIDSCLFQEKSLSLPNNYK